MNVVYHFRWIWLRKREPKEFYCILILRILLNRVGISITPILGGCPEWLFSPAQFTSTMAILLLPFIRPLVNII